MANVGRVRTDKLGSTARRSSWLAENEVFVRRARDAARQAIFLLDHGRRTGRDWVDVRLARSRGFMLTQVRAVVQAVSLPEMDKQGPDSGPAPAAASLEEEVLWPRGITRAGPLEILEQWRQVRDLLDNEAPPPDGPLHHHQPAGGQPAPGDAPPVSAGAAESRPLDKKSDPVQEIWLSLRRFLYLSRPPLSSAVHRFLPSFRILDHWRITAVRFLARRIVSLLTLIVAIVVLTKVEAVSNLVRNDYRANGAFLLGTVLLAASLWLIPLAGWWATGGLGIRAFWSPRYQAVEPERGIARWPDRGGAAHILSIVFAVTGLVAVIWFPLVVVMIDERRRTLFSILYMLSGVLFGAHLLDRWDFVDSRPVRFLGLAWAATLLFLVTWSQGAIAPRTEAALRFLAAGTFAPAVVYHARRAWRGLAPWVVSISLMVGYAGIGFGIVWGAVTSDHEAWRDGPPAAGDHVPPRKPIDRLCAGQWPYPNRDRTTPIVLVAASGGGSRAAYFTARTLELLDELPAAAADAAPGDQPRGHVGDYIHAISSVSGGSLAAAGYIAQRYRYLHPHDLTMPKAEPGVLARAPANLGEGERDPDEEDQKREKGASGETLEPSRTRSLAAAVNRDFLWPTIKGFLVPFVSRGRVLEDAWENGPVGLAGLDLGKLADEWREPAGELPPFPMPLFNSCSLDGHDVVISPLPRGLYSDSSGATWQALRDHYGLKDSRLEPRGEKRADPRGENLTWVAGRDEIYGLEQLLPRFNPSLAQAVRASANFPYGFPLVLLDVPLANQVLSPRWYPGAKGNESVKLTDGGALSNSGLWSLYRLMTLRPAIVAELRRRGVLLVIVEASHMPEYEERAREVLAIRDTIQNKNPMAQYLHREMLARLKRDYAGALEIVQLDVPPTEELNVLTTWSLDGKSQDILKKAFETVSGLEGPGLAQKWQRLRQRVKDEPVPARDPRGPCDSSGNEPAAAAGGAGAATPVEIFGLRPPLD